MIVLIVIAFLAFRRDRRPPDILLITLDTTRADHIGAYGDARARTPHIDRLASEGVLFERALATAPITLPSHVSLFTGLYPFVHGVRNNGNFALRDGVPTLATTLHDRGYRTAAFVSAFVLDRRRGLARGFDHYDDAVGLERRGDRTAAAAAAWLQSATDPAPVFVWVHLYDPHDPYEPPAPYRDDFAGRPYDGELALADAAIGTVLDRLDRGRRASPMIAVVGDHGESLGEHREETHAMFVYEAVLRVPMIVSWPGRLPAGRKVPALVRAVDLAPTLLDLAGQPPLAGAQGQSLVALVQRGSPGPSSAYGETYFPLLYMNWAPLRSIQDDRWKFIDAPTPELYDLSRDEHEQTNLAAQEPARAAALRRALDEITNGTPGAMSEKALDKETAEKLAALGYIGGIASAAIPRPGRGQRDPKDMIGIFNRLRQANASAQARHFAEAEAIAREVLALDAGNGFARIVLANAEFEQGRWREAIIAYRAYLEVDPASADTHHRIAICHARSNESDRAMAEEDAALAIDPRHADAHEHRGGLLAARGRIDDALTELRAAVDIDPDNVPYRVGLARVLVTAQRLDAGEVELRKALELQPQNADAHAAYGGLLAARGRLDEALVEFGRSLQIRPDADDVRLDRAGTIERLGRRAEAGTEYQRLATGPDTPPDIRQTARARLRQMNR